MTKRASCSVPSPHLTYASLSKSYIPYVNAASGKIPIIAGPTPRYRAGQVMLATSQDAIYVKK